MFINYPRTEEDEAGLAVAIAELLRLQYPLYALIGAVIVSDLSPSQTRQLGLRRLAGSALGARLVLRLAIFATFGQSGSAS
jgi:uncharacterized membrane protein YgaE (UPF0421/DUF939 family)